MRRRLSEREFRRQLAKIKSENTQKERQMALDAEKNKYSKKQFETSKLIAIYLFVLLNGIVIFAMVAMWHFADLSYLGVLITDIAAQVLIYAIYCLKAYHAKKQSEKLKFDREKYKGSLGEVLEAGAESNDYVPLTNGNIDVPQTYYEDSVG